MFIVHLDTLAPNLITGYQMPGVVIELLTSLVSLGKSATIIFRMGGVNLEVIVGQSIRVLNLQTFHQLTSE